MTDPAELEVVTTNFRVAKGLLSKIDARAEAVGLSRNKWLTKALAYIIEELPVDAPMEKRREARALWLSGEL